MKKLEIDYIAPEGKELATSSSSAFVERLNEEINNFSNSVLPDNQQINPKTKLVPKDKGGLPELVQWAIQFYQENEEIIKLTISFISNLRMIVKTFIGSKPKKDDNHIVIKFDGKKLKLPNTDDEIEKFIKEMNNKLKK